MSEHAKTYYAHFPKLVVPPEGVATLGGRLEPFRFEDFKRLDGDWAHQSYFERTEPTVWRRHLSQDESPSVGAKAEQGVDDEGRWTHLRESTGLIYYALLAEVRVLLPDPSISMCYLTEGRTVERRVGPYHRTLLINGDKLSAIETADLNSAAGTAEMWARGGLVPSARVFGPLRCLSLLGAGALNPVFGVVPLIVALEGYLLGRKVDGGIAANMASAIQALCGTAAPPAIAADMRRIYAWRSEILHGRQISDPNLRELFRSLCSIATLVVRCAVQRVLARKSDGNDLAVIRIGP